MPSSNQFKPFGTGAGANVLSPTAYAALTTLLANGFQTGTASSVQVNTVLRQSAFVASTLAQTVADALGQAVNDDGITLNFQAQLEAAIKVLAAPIPAGTRMPFAQAAAPTGWTQDTSDNANNRMLRVVNTAGGGVAGTHSPVLNNVVPSHTHGFTTGTESSDHAHGDSGHSHYYTSPALRANNAAGSIPDYITTAGANTNTGYAALGGRTVAHTHSGSTDNGSSQTNWTPRYIDLIICSKN